MLWELVRGRSVPCMFSGFRSLLLPSVGRLDVSGINVPHPACSSLQLIPEQRRCVNAPALSPSGRITEAGSVLSPRLLVEVGTDAHGGDCSESPFTDMLSFPFLSCVDEFSVTIMKYLK